MEPNLLASIFQYLDPKDLSKVAACNKYFRSVVAVEPLLWPTLDTDTSDDLVIHLIRTTRLNCLIPCSLGNVVRLQLVDQCPSSQGDVAQLGLLSNDSCSELSSYWLNEGRCQDRIAWINRWLWNNRKQLFQFEPTQQDKLRARMQKIPIKDIVNSDLEIIWQKRWERARSVVMSMENQDLAIDLSTFWNQISEMGHVDEMDTIDMDGLAVESDDEMSTSTHSQENLFDSIEYPNSTEANVVKRLTYASELLLANLDQNPSHIPSLYLLSFLAYLCNSSESCTELLDILQEIDADYEPALELRRELLLANSPTDKVPLLDESGLNLSTQLDQAVQFIFERLDVDEDGFLSPREELAQFFRICNPGQEPPPLNILLTMCRNYNSADKRRGLTQAEIRKGLTLDGLKKFFYVQSGEDEAETRRDLEKFGFNSETLQ
jgi:hypothetical protein